jgi:hypothetical protein
MAKVYTIYLVYSIILSIMNQADVLTSPNGDTYVIQIPHTEEGFDLFPYQVHRADYTLGIAQGTLSPAQVQDFFHAVDTAGHANPEKIGEIPRELLNKGGTFFLGALVDITDTRTTRKGEAVTQTHALVLASRSEQNPDEEGGISAFIFNRSGSIRGGTLGPGETEIMTLAVVETDILVGIADPVTLRAILQIINANPDIKQNIEGLVQALRPVLEQQGRGDFASGAVILHALSKEITGPLRKTAQENTQQTRKRFGITSNQLAKTTGRALGTVGKVAGTAVAMEAKKLTTQALGKRYSRARQKHNPLVAGAVAGVEYLKDAAAWLGGAAVLGALIGTGIWIGNNRESFPLDAIPPVPAVTATLPTQQYGECEVHAPNPGTPEDPGFVNLRRQKGLDKEPTGKAFHGEKVRYVKDGDEAWRTLPDGSVIYGDVCIPIEQ